MDEMIEILRGLETGEFFEYHGKHYDVQRIKMCPTPSERIPILIGGHSEPALARAARLGDGWMHAGGPAEDLASYIDRLRELRRDCGRDHLPFEVHVISPDAHDLDGVRRLEDLGVTDAIVGFRKVYASGSDVQSLQGKIDALRRFADDVISKL
jgi:alkanesulfonate monooxygenase SsuD/methylene tetrahydromethanopterin reductase-like flavin-dependent oxidoreductase (luciferase family)